MSENWIAVLHRLANSELRRHWEAAAPGDRHWFSFEQGRAAVATLAQAIANDHELGPLDCVQVNLGTAGHHSIHHDEIARGLLAWSMRFGPDSATSSLSSWLSESFNSVDFVVALSGVEVESLIDLGESVFLVPWDELAQSESKSQVEEARRTMPSVFDAPISAALYRRVSATPKFFSGADRRETDVSSFEADQELDDVRLLIALACGTAVGAVAMWSGMAGAHPVTRFVGPRGVRFQPTVRPKSPIPKRIADQSGDELAGLVAQFRRLDADAAKRLRVSLSRLCMARSRFDNESRAIDLGIALESLLVSDNRGEQLGFTFRIRGAWLLGQDAVERQRLAEELKVLYNLRSRAVHAGELAGAYKFPTRRTGEVTTFEILDRGEVLCGNVVRAILHLGEFPNWDNLVFGSALP